MSKVQKDRLLSLQLKEKKLIRLLYHNDLTDEDSHFLNRLYEEKQHLHFYYGMALPLFVTLGTNYMLFRTNSRWFQISYCVLFGAGMHLQMGRRINKRFHALTNPYFQKYQIN